MLPLLLALPTLLAGRTDDPLRELEAWIHREERVRDPLEPAREAELRALLGEVRILLSQDAGRRVEAELLLLDLAALDWLPRERRERAARDGEREGRRAYLALGELGRLLDGPGGRAAARRLATDVLARPDRHPPGRRTAAADALSGRQVPETLPSLLQAARDADPDLRRAAAEALVGWPDAAVHLLFLEALRGTDLPVDLAVRHFAACAGELGPQALSELQEEAGRLYLSPDWRDAALARELVEPLPNERAVPLLIESLATWKRREADGEGSRRIVDELVLALRKRSARSLGDDPDAWSGWWRGVQEGRITTPGEDGELHSVATFFGLRAVSDRIVFVLDASGSMDQVFGADGRTRYGEAVEQLLGWLEEAGPGTRFNIVTFQEGARRWRPGLVPATANNLRQARVWLESREPEGGTDLVAGLREALDLDRSGRFLVRRVEADTFVVLSDEERSRGTRWDLDWLEPILPVARAVFHCVQIGRESSEVLAGLARRTGGTFLRIRD